MTQEELFSMLNKGGVSRDRALTEVYHEFFHLVGWCIKKGMPEEKALDAYSDTILALDRSVRAGKQIETLSAYLMGIIKHKLADNWRNKKTLLEEVHEDQVSTNPEPGVLDCLEKALEKIPDFCNNLLIDVGTGFTYPEISEKYDLPLDQVRRRVYDCRKKLGEMMDQICN
ncbi:MAG: sigma-70 family RNA polymerase sigma factor [Lewinellaceae bacterium]|nr:sigma-70 family RNA polymerase sigma factor [Lewinellaceae bacterium]